MTLLLFGAATCVLVTCCILYYNGRLWAAGIGGLVYGGLIGTVAARSMAPWLAIVLVALFAVAPGVYVIVHAVDARRGLFLLPTIYSIPLAFLAGVILWGCTGLGLLL